MDPISPIIQQMIQQIVTNLLNTLVDDKVDNKYLKAALMPLTVNFVNGIMSGQDPQAMGEGLRQPFPQGIIDPTTGKAIGNLPADPSLYGNFYQNTLLGK